MIVCFIVKQRTAYEMRISDWSSDVCSSDLGAVRDGLSLVRLILMKAGGSTMGRPFQRLRACSFSQSAFSLMAPKSLCSGDGAEMTAQDIWLIVQIGRASGRERVCEYV